MEPLKELKHGRFVIWVYPDCRNGKPEYRTSLFSWHKPAGARNWRRQTDLFHSDFEDVAHIYNLAHQWMSENPIQSFTSAA